MSDLKSMLAERNARIAELQQELTLVRAERDSFEALLKEAESGVTTVEITDYRIAPPIRKLYIERGARIWGPYSSVEEARKDGFVVTPE